jgi:hypothetical protein
MRVQGTIEAKQRAVADRIQAFKEAFHSEADLLHYFEVHWQEKSGKLLQFVLVSVHMQVTRTLIQKMPFVLNLFEKIEKVI